MSAPPQARRNATILVVQDYFLPGYKGGGSVRSVANLIARLQEDYQFLVVARDRDRGDREPYPDHRPGWTQREGCHVNYLAPSQVHPWGLRRALAGATYDLVYFNSFFSRLTIWLLVARRLGMVPRCPVVLAPRGEFARNALAFKHLRKSLYLWIARRLGLYRGITWQVSSEREREELSELLGEPSEIALNLPSPPPTNGELPALPEKHSGTARFVFLSRLVPKKNLETAIDLIGQIDGDVVFDIFGTAEDPDYLANCMARIEALPRNVRCRYRGPVPHESVHAMLARYHFFFFPTLNENFGHVILEALVTGLPLLVSNQTFWRDLERKDVGFDLDLADQAGFVDCLTRFTAMGPDEYLRRSSAARKLADGFLADPGPLEANRRLFRQALERTNTLRNRHAGRRREGW